MMGVPAAERFDWTEDRIALAKRMWADDASASEIAEALGCGVSRNAVIGKLHRLVGTKMSRGRGALTTKLKHKRRAGRRDQGGSTIHAIRNKRFGDLRSKRKAPAPDFGEIVLPSDDVTDLQIPVEQRRTLLELEPHHCRFSVGEPGTAGFFFCGGAKEIGPYCALHAARCFGAWRLGNMKWLTKGVV